MNVECSKCPAKYGVPDAKVRGRKVRITCKRCGAPIIIDGTALALDPSGRQQRTMLGGLDAAPGSAPGAGSSQPPSPRVEDKAPSPEPPRSAPHYEPPSASSAAEPPTTPTAAKPPRSSAPPEEPWTVAVTENDQREMTTQQVVAAYVSGVIDEETFVWRDGMEDWLTPFEVPEIADALRARGLAPPAPEARTSNIDLGAQRAGTWLEPGRWDSEDVRDEMGFDEVTVAMAAPRAQELLEAVSSRSLELAAESSPDASSPLDLDDFAGSSPTAAQSSELSARAETAPSDSGTAATATPLGGVADAVHPPEASSRPGAAARRREREQEPEKDLFGQAAQRAGSEEEQAEQHEQEPAAAEPAHGLTGARNESSVLFSLDALSRQGQPKPSAIAKEDRFDEGALLGGPEPSRATTSKQDTAPDSIANLGGGGMFGSTMVAPDFTAAPVPSERPPRSERPKAGDSLAPERKGSAGIWIGLIVLLAAAGGGFYYYQRMAQTQVDSEPAPSAEALPVDEPPQETEPVEETNLDDEEEATTETGESSSSPSAASPVSSTAPGQPTEDLRPAAEQPQAPGGGTTTTTAAATKREETTSPSDESAGSGPEFDVAAAKASLSAAAANAASSCGTPDGPHGTGKVSVTFANSGRATRTIVTGDFAGSAVGGCIARIFRGAQVPPFGGDVRRVTKTVTIQ